LHELYFPIILNKYPGFGAALKSNATADLKSESKPCCS